VNTVMNLRIPKNVRKFLNSCTIGGFSRRAQLHEVSFWLVSTYTDMGCPVIVVSSI
jgi:hypothetical protein